MTHDAAKRDYYATLCRLVRLHSLANVLCVYSSHRKVLTWRESYWGAASQHCWSQKST